MKEIIKVLLQEGIDESMINRVLDLIEEEYEIVNELKVSTVDNMTDKRYKRWQFYKKLADTIETKAVTPKDEERLARTNKWAEQAEDEFDKAQKHANRWKAGIRTREENSMDIANRKKKINKKEA